MNIWQQKGWPFLTWDNKELSCVLGEVRNRQGCLAGKAGILSYESQKKVHLMALLAEIIHSAKLENKVLTEGSVEEALGSVLTSPSSEAIANYSYTERIVQATSDAMLNVHAPITEARLLDWKNLLSQDYNKQGLTHIDYRKIQNEPVHELQMSQFYYQDVSSIGPEVQRFVKWLNTCHPTDPIIKAGVAYLRFTFIQPFNEDNGQLARLISNAFLARVDKFPQRLYSISEQMYKEIESYEYVLKSVDNNNLDITEWLLWFLYTFDHALIEAEKRLKLVLDRLKFWETNRLVSLNERQVKMINLLWEGMGGKLTSSIWASINLCSPDTALRDIQDLIEKKILHKKESGGRSTSYELN